MRDRPTQESSVTPKQLLQAGVWPSNPMLRCRSEFRLGNDRFHVPLLVPRSPSQRRASTSVVVTRCAPARQRRPLAVIDDVLSHFRSLCREVITRLPQL